MHHNPMGVVLLQVSNSRNSQLLLSTWVSCISPSPFCSLHPFGSPSTFTNVFEFLTTFSFLSFTFFPQFYFEYFVRSFPFFCLLLYQLDFFSLFQLLCDMYSKVFFSIRETNKTFRMYGKVLPPSFQRVFRRLAYRIERILRKKKENFFDLVALSRLLQW